MVICAVIKLRMWLRALLLLVVLVCFSVSASRNPKIDRKTFTDVSSPVHLIYPRTGRLFHADFVRDNQIFRSLERTNFMRRGTFAKGIVLRKPKSGNIEPEDVQKKHVYLALGRLPGVGTKKGVMNLEKDIPSKSVLVKISKSEGPGMTHRSKRDIEKVVNIDKDENKTKVTESTFDTAKLEMSSENKPIGTVKAEELSNKPENKVEEDSKPVVRNNDTDKTLLVYDAKLSADSTGSEFRIPEVDDHADKMKKTVVNDELELYPVYRGVKYFYPHIERRLLYSPQLSVQMDLPAVSDYLSVAEQNSTSQSEVEGRGRRPLKKLALPLLLALKLKTAILLPVILGLVSLLAFKGLWSGLTALGIAGALGLKALLGPATKVVVQPPPPAPHFHHFPPHAEVAEYWSRRGDDFNDYRPNTWT